MSIYAGIQGRPYLCPREDGGQNPPHRCGANHAGLHSVRGVRNRIVKEAILAGLVRSQGGLFERGIETSPPIQCVTYAGFYTLLVRCNNIVRGSRRRRSATPCRCGKGADLSESE